MKKAILYLIFISNLFAILWLWWQGSGGLITQPGPGTIAIAFGRLCGLLAEFLILFQLILVSRASWIEQVFGFDRLNKLHRGLGSTILSLILIHPTLLTLGYSTQNHISLWSQYTQFLFHWEDVFLAFISLILFVIVVISAITLRRKLKYESWYFVHLLVYVAIGLVVLHQFNGSDIVVPPFLYYWFALTIGVFGIFIVYRFGRPLYSYWRHRFYVDKIVAETNTINSIYIKGHHLEHFKFKAGQYANINFLAKGQWYTHPFSFSTAPNGSYLRFSIKKVGDFTSQLHRLQPGTRAIIDGPLGIFTADRATTGKFLLIAGGIGITPIMALIESQKDTHADTVLLYSNKSGNEIAFEAQLKQLCPRSYFFLTDPTVSQDYIPGRITVEHIQKLIPDMRERDIYICGPTPMMDDLIAALRRYGISASRLHYEKFAY